MPPDPQPSSVDQRVAMVDPVLAAKILEVNLLIAEFDPVKKTQGASEASDDEASKSPEYDPLRLRLSDAIGLVECQRLVYKYLIFDLEATRRENGQLRKMLEETSGNND